MRTSRLSTLLDASLLLLLICGSSSAPAVMARSLEQSDDSVSPAAAAAAAAAAAVAPWEPDAINSNAPEAVATSASAEPNAEPAATSLDRKVTPVPAYNFTTVINAQDNTPAGKGMRKVLQVLKDFKVPSATLAVQNNTDPANISYAPPAVWRKGGQVWLMYGFRISYRAPMRVASVSKPLTVAVWRNNGRLARRQNALFYTLWKTWVNSKVVAPKDARVLNITITHLINHASGFDNGKTGFDPAFAGASVESQMNGILNSTMLAFTPGNGDSYSNFGYMILAKLAAAITGKTFITLVSELFPANPATPIFAANDTAAVQANVSGANNPGAAEPSTYYVQGNDGTFDVTPMAGNGNIVANVATLSWFGTQYWLLGDSLGGRSFARSPPQKNYAWIMDGSMPGTIAVLTQYINQAAKPSCFAVIINTRPPNSDLFLDKLNAATLDYLKVVFNATTP